MTHDDRQRQRQPESRTAAAVLARVESPARGFDALRDGSRAGWLHHSPRQVAQARRFSALTGHPPVVQREASVNSEAKLGFFVDAMTNNAKARFTNATEAQLDNFRLYINARWGGAFSPEEPFTKSAARSSWSAAECLKHLGKETPVQDHYKWLSDALDQTFSEDTDHSFQIFSRPTVKMDQYPAGSDPWLDQLHGEGLIEPEDKTGNNRLKTCALNNIVETNADNGTATALYTIDHTESSEPEIKARDGAWELHAHVRQNGAVVFAHTKRNQSHATTVNEWFKTKIDVADRQWS